MALLTTVEMAKRLGVSPRRVLQLASLRGVEPARLVGRAALWESNDVRRLKPKRVGRPRGS